ncbi:MAG: hypothetical protein AAF512_20560 [Pseudomonadota bacterium]
MQKIQEEDRADLKTILTYLQQRSGQYFTAQDTSKATKLSVGAVLRLFKYYQDIFTKLPGKNELFMLNNLHEHQGNPTKILVLLESQHDEQDSLEYILQKAYTPVMPKNP